MSAGLAVAAVAFAVVALYAIFGGADFGGGVWNALATGPRAGRQRSTIAHAIGPVWETNHVWLIFLVVLLFTCVPAAFADIAVGLYVPLTFALVGVILRGAAYAFRQAAREGALLSTVWGHVFGIASVVAPFFLGAAVGGLATGGYRWASPFALVVGCFAVGLCAQLAAVFLTLEGEGELGEDFRVRGMTATAAVAAIGAIALGVARATALPTFLGLVRAGSLAWVGAAMILGLAVLASLHARRYRLARIAVALETVAILAGWLAAQAPYAIPGALTFAAALAPAATLQAFLTLVLAGGVLLAPSLWLLFRVFKTGSRRGAVAPH